MRQVLLLGWLASTAASWAAQPDYLPLQVGNQWVLQTQAPTPEILNMEVLRSRTLDGQTYYLLSGYGPQPLWVRKTEDGTLLAIDESSGEETTVAQLSLGGAAYQTALSGCNQGAQPAAEANAYGGPFLQADSALVVRFAPDGCRDVGFAREIYAPGLGLVERALTTIRGETTFDLVYARVNGSAVLGTAKELVLTDDFNTGSKGWLAGFSDYSLRTSDLRMLAELRPLPDEVSSQRSGFYLQSMNRSDDVFMFLKKNISTADGLAPNQAYRLSFDIRFSSNAPSGCLGIGGSPGESVYLKAGGSVDEPLTLLAGNEIQISADKGQQAVGGRDAGVVGTIANGTPCNRPPYPYVGVRKQYTHSQPVQTDERGALWLLLGTDSGYEGLTGLYVEQITVRIAPVQVPQ